MSQPAAAPARFTVSTTTARLLAGGVVAGPLFLLSWAVQAATRAGFDATVHPMSLLALGDLGWVQVATFVVTGALFMACSRGLREALPTGRGGTWVPRLVRAMGNGFIAAGEIDRAVFALEVATRSADGQLQWHATDRGEPRWRIARSGCFRAAVPLPPGTTAERITQVRLRAYTRPRRDGEPIMPPGTGVVRLHRFNGVFMLDDQYRPRPALLASTRVISARGEGDPVVVSAPPSADRKP